MSDLRYEPLTVDKAEALVACVKAVYGENYSLPEFYDSQRIRDLLRDGLLHAFVGLNPQGEIVATLSAQLECPGAITIDGRTGMVRNEYRQHGALTDLGMRMHDIYRGIGICGLQMYAVTFHTISQRHGLNYGCFVTGLLPAHFPRTMVPEEFGAFTGRFGAVTMYYLMQPLPPADVCLPAVYRDMLREIYARHAIARNETPPDDTTVADSTHYKLVFNDRTGVTTAQVNIIGQDFAAMLDDIITQGSRRGSAAIYLDLPLASPACPLAAGIANRQGFFFGALLPARKYGDMLRLQKFDLAETHPEEMKLHSDEVRRMLDFVLADAHRLEALA